MAPRYERRPLTVLLDGVQSHHEIGEIFRLCDAFCVQRLVICGVRFNIHNRKLQKAAKGAQHNLPWTTADSAFQIIKSAKDYGVYVVVMGRTAGALSIQDLNPDFPALLVLSSEHLSPNQPIQDWADSVVRIPNIVESLSNVSAAAILMHNITSSVSRLVSATRQV